LEVAMLAFVMLTMLALWLGVFFLFFWSARRDSKRTLRNAVHASPPRKPSQEEMVRQNISSGVLRPAYQELAMWHQVADIYRSGLEITALGRASNVLSSNLADPIADVRVYAAGGSSTLTDKIIND